MVRWLRFSCGIALAAVLLAHLWDHPARHARGPITLARPAYAIDEPDFFLYVPSHASHARPVQILVALHGVGDNGPAFCRGLLATAERNGWIVLAPTFTYRDYQNPDLVLRDDTTLLPRLAATIDAIPGRTGLATRERVLLYGFSRGAQAAQRFATFYPERVAGVAVLSAGSYTLPLDAMRVGDGVAPLPMPYGVADARTYLGEDFDAAAFRRVPFRVAVGELDTDPSAAPRGWDRYLGRTRLDRARAYTKTLQDIGVRGSLAVYPGVGHTITADMQADALRFLAAQAAATPGRESQGRDRGHGGLAGHQRLAGSGRLPRTFRAVTAAWDPTPRDPHTGREREDQPGPPSAIWL